jgi:hypothetical protein
VTQHNALVPYNPKAVQEATTRVTLGDRRLVIEADGGPTQLNDINIAAYTLLKEVLFQLRPNEIQFLGGMTKVNSISQRQRKWLRDLLKKHLGINLDDEPLLV